MFRVTRYPMISKTESGRVGYKKKYRVPGVRPVGIRNPLIRTLHSRVIRENRAALTAVLEPQQLALSLAGGHKLVHQVRTMMEEHRDWVDTKRNEQCYYGWLYFNRLL